MPRDVILLAGHDAECDAMMERNGWEGRRWIQEWRPPLYEYRDSLGRKHRHGDQFVIWRCAGLWTCPGRALIRESTQRATISALIDEATP